MLRDEPKGWRRLQRKAQRESDPQKLALIIDDMNRLLDEHERMAAGRDAREGRKVDRSPSEQSFA